MKQWLRYLWQNEDGFFGIGMGPSDSQKADAGALGAISNFATSEGETDIMASDKFWQAILSGDPGQIAKVMGPAMSATNKRGQEANKTAAEFGTRSGGTNAGAQMTGDKVRSSIDEMISKLTGDAAGALGSSGHSLLGTGLSARNDKFGADTTIHDENSAKWNDIFKSAASLAAAPFTGGASLAGLGTGGGTMKKPGGGGSGNWWDNVNFPGDSGGSDVSDAGGFS